MNNQKTYYVPEGFTPIAGSAGESGTPGEKSEKLKIEPGQSFLGVIERRMLNKQSKFGQSDYYFLKPVLDYKPEQGICVYGEKDVFFAASSEMLRERLSGVPDNSLVCIVNQGKPDNKNYYKWEVFVDTRYKPVASTTSAIPQAHHYAQQQYQQPVMPQPNNQYGQPQYMQPVQNPQYMNPAQNPIDVSVPVQQNPYSIPSSKDDDLPF